MQINVDKASLSELKSHFRLFVDLVRDRSMNFDQMDTGLCRLHQYYEPQLDSILVNWTADLRSFYESNQALFGYVSDMLRYLNVHEHKIGDVQAQTARNIGLGFDHCLSKLPFPVIKCAPRRPSIGENPHSAFVNMDQFRLNPDLSNSDADPMDNSRHSDGYRMQGYVDPSGNEVDDDIFELDGSKIYNVRPCSTNSFCN